jgi:hypothetical protein
VGYQSVWEVCVWLLDWITFCWCTTLLLAHKPTKHKLNPFQYNYIKLSIVTLCQTTL